jgi:hypothetical protein
MELPNDLKHLYRHWYLHSGVGADKFPDSPLFNELSLFIKERIHIWEKKTSGKAPPYTTDPVLLTYRFCNIFREFDKQTIEFHTLLNPLRGDFPLWLLNMFYCRMVARPETITFAGLLSFDPEENKKVFEKLTTSPRPRFGTPYVFPVSTILRSATPTRELFITHHLPLVMRSIASLIETWDKLPVADGVEKILPMFGFNLHFLWTEVLIDAAYQYPEMIDLFTRFPTGPGSLPTFKRIDAEKDPETLAEELARLEFDTGITFNGQPLRLSAENWEGIGCEFRKYTNLKNGVGRKRLYK